MTDRESVLRHQEALSNLIGCPGHEEEVTAYLRAEVEPLAERVWLDPLGNLLAVRPGSATQSRRILLDAHVDEVGFMVSHVDANGFIRVEALGSIDKRLAPGLELAFRSDSGETVRGVVGAAPPHVTTPGEREKVPDIRELFVDIGAGSDEEVGRSGIHVGSVGTFATAFHLLNQRIIAGKAFDDRTACNVVLHVLKELAKRDCPNTVVCNFAVQEEVGGRGAVTGAYSLEPELALAIENTTATDVPGVPPERVVTRLGAGPAVTLADRSHIVPRAVVRRIQQAAERNEPPIPWQYKKPIYGGTDAGKIAPTRGGVPTGVISVPCRYIHAPVALLDLQDLVHTIDLVTAFCMMPV